MISRRDFLALTAVTAVAPGNLFAAEKVPPMLDHLLLGCSDLDQGIAFVEGHTGVRPAIGGVHPGRGTRNALLSLGKLRYLEVIAPDLAQTGTPTTRADLAARLKRLTSPTLVEWAVHTSDIVGVADRWRKAGVAFQGPTAGSRARPDGEMLHWQTLNVNDDRNGLIPFFIQWGDGTTHPSVDAPQGCTLESFAVVTPEATPLAAEFQKLGIDDVEVGRLGMGVEFPKGTQGHLWARIVGPKGPLHLGE